MSEAHDDVRMRGFRRRAAVDEVCARLRGWARTLPAESVPVEAAAGRILAADLIAPIDVPGFVRAAVDGYAVRGEDTFAASDLSPIPLRLRGVSLPGRPCPEGLVAGEAIRITTGAPLPAGADAVLQAELARPIERGGRALVEAIGPVAPLRHLGQVGEDIPRGSTILAAGRALRPQDAGVIASLGLAAIEVVRRPRALVLVTGDELVPAGAPLGPHQIVESNSVTLAGLLRRDHAALVRVIRSRDGEAAVGAALDACEAAEADVIVASGATSLGSEDWLPVLLARRGRVDVHGIAMRPSSPTGVGRLADGRPVLLLPGNPVSCLCAYEFFVGPLLRALGGRPDPWRWPHPRRSLPLARKITSKVGRTDFVRARIVGAGEAAAIEPLATSGASLLSSTVVADGAVIVPPESEGHPEGEVVELLGFDGGGAP
ncbi:MAG: molybdopterin molybdotransferase MoeA [Nannocystaceae bacterium]